MAANTAISWTHNSHNFWWGCTEVSPGCTNCYARELAKKFRKMEWGPGTPRQRASDKVWRTPYAWDEKAAREGVRVKVFANSMADFFDAEVDPAWRKDAWDVIRGTPNLDWQILTKRPSNIKKMLPPDWGEGYPNVWLGTSVENQGLADIRIPVLLGVPARVRFLSVEPLLTPIDLAFYLPKSHAGNGGIDWVIVGGESGPHHRPMDPKWASNIRDQCLAAGVAFFFKQSSGRLPGRGTLLDGVEHHAFPVVA